MITLSHGGKANDPINCGNVYEPIAAAEETSMELGQQSTEKIGFHVVVAQRFCLPFSQVSRMIEPLE